MPCHSVLLCYLLDQGRAQIRCTGLRDVSEGIALPAQALILSEKLQGVGTAFDRCRSVRYRQLLQQQRQLQQKRQRLNAIQVSGAALKRCMLQHMPAQPVGPAVTGGELPDSVQDSVQDSVHASMGSMTPPAYLNFHVTCTHDVKQRVSSCERRL